MIPTYLRRERLAIAPELEQDSPTSREHIRLFIDHLVTPESMQKWLERRHQDCASGEIVPATSLISEKLDRLLVMHEGSCGYMVNGEQKVVEFNYTFSDNAPPAKLPTYGHIFDAESLSVTPRSKTPESMQR